MIRTLDGERSLAAQYYGSIYAGPNGWYSDPWGGLGGGGRTGRIGDSIDMGRDFVFIHELGHGWNPPPAPVRTTRARTRTRRRPQGSTWRTT